MLSYDDTTNEGLEVKKAALEFQNYRSKSVISVEVVQVMQ